MTLDPEWPWTVLIQGHGILASNISNTVRDTTSDTMRSDRKQSTDFWLEQWSLTLEDLNRLSSRSLQLSSNILITVYGMQQYWADTRSIERIYFLSVKVSCGTLNPTVMYFTALWICKGFIAFFHLSVSIKRFHLFEPGLWSTSRVSDYEGIYWKFKNQSVLWQGEVSFDLQLLRSVGQTGCFCFSQRVRIANAAL